MILAAGIWELSWFTCERKDSSAEIETSIWYTIQNTFSSSKSKKRWFYCFDYFEQGTRKANNRTYFWTIFGKMNMQNLYFPSISNYLLEWHRKMPDNWANASCKMEPYHTHNAYLNMGSQKTHLYATVWFSKNRLS